VGPDPPPVERICARGPLLVHFIDAGHMSSVRTLPYVRAWKERYAVPGLTVVGVNSPRFEFTADAGKLAAALARLGVAHPIAADSSYAIWHDYGCEGWPSLFLWGRGGALRWFHFGEGEYGATERAIQEELTATDPRMELPEPLAPLRPSDAPGALVVTPTEEMFPGGSPSEPWIADRGAAALELDYAAGGLWASLDGAGTLAYSLDAGPETKLRLEAPGAYELASHPRHEEHHASLRIEPGISVYSIAFAAGVP
jgi:hypothetical protein